MTILRSGSWGILGYTALAQFTVMPAFQHGQFIFSTDLRTWDILNARPSETLKDNRWFVQNSKKRAVTGFIFGKLRKRMGN